MSRDSNGNYTLPEADFATGTTIEAPAMNSNLGDLETAITDSLDRNGKGGMLARLRGVDGTAAAPAYSFTSETDIGFYRAGSGDVRFSDGAADVLKISAAENRSYNAFKVSTGGVTVDAGGLTVTADGVDVTDGGLSVLAGGSSLSGALVSSGVVASPHLAISAGTMASTSGNTYALHNARGTGFGNNVLNLTARARNTTAVTDWNQIDVGLTYDVDSSVAAGGSLYLGKNGATITSGTAATGATPANALTLANGNLKVSGTAPNKDAATSNTITPANITQVWVRITADGVNAAGIIAADGYNVSSISWDNITNTLTVNFAVTFANTHYAVGGLGDLSASSATRVPCVYTRATTNLTVALLDVATGNPVDLDSFANSFSLLIIGRLA